jgi:Mn-dependent DtxR family transcriptional regulator
MNKKDDYLKILPGSIKEPFSTKDIACELGISKYLAKKILYFYKKVNLINCIGKKGNLLLYKRNRSG